MLKIQYIFFAYQLGPFIAAYKGGGPNETNTRWSENPSHPWCFLAWNYKYKLAWIPNLCHNRIISYNGITAYLIFTPNMARTKLTASSASLLYFFIPFNLTYLCYKSQSKDTVKSTSPLTKGKYFSPDFLQIL